MFLLKFSPQIRLKLQDWGTVTGPRDGSMTGSFQGLVVDMKYPPERKKRCLLGMLTGGSGCHISKNNMCQRKPKGYGKD